MTLEGQKYKCCRLVLLCKSDAGFPITVGCVSSECRHDNILESSLVEQEERSHDMAMLCANAATYRQIYAYNPMPRP